jgi:cytochrome d ubiquinol oxidase subunit II
LLFVVGVALVLHGIMKTVKYVDRSENPYIRGIWLVGTGVVLTVLALLLCAGYNNTAYYPSTANIQNSLTLNNSCSSEFTLKTMSVVSLFVPFVLAYIAYVWHSMDKKKIDRKEVETDHHLY